MIANDLFYFFTYMQGKIYGGEKLLVDYIM